jgi:hypothetical protein
LVITFDVSIFSGGSGYYINIQVRAANMQIRTIFIYGLFVLAVALIGIRLWLVNGPEAQQTSSVVSTAPTPLASDEQRIIELQANENWRLIGKGPIRIRASGTADLGGGLKTAPNDEQKPGDETALAPDLPYGTLVARIGENGKPFKIGISGQINAREPVYLAINDGDRSDNSGFYTVTLTGGTKY